MGGFCSFYFLFVYLGDGFMRFICAWFLMLGCVFIFILIEYEFIYFLFMVVC